VLLPDIRQRSGYLLLAVVVGHLILISAQVNSQEGVPLLEGAAFAVYSEVQRLTYAVVGGAVRLWNGYVALRYVRIENAALQQELATLQVQQQQQEASVRRSGELRRLLELRDASDLQTRAAEVIGWSAVPGTRFLTIDRGSSDDIKENMAVISPAGVVGRVVRTARKAALVQLLVDRNAAAGARAGDARAEGIVVGTGADTLRMDYVSSTADLAVGELVVTAGTDGIYPKGFAIGHIEHIEKAGSAYALIRIRPAVNFAALEEVLVVTSPVPSGREVGQ
jgi:rod shape-determining protein MreC